MTRPESQSSTCLSWAGTATLDGATVSRFSFTISGPSVVAPQSHTLVGGAASTPAMIGSVALALGRLYLVVTLLSLTNTETKEF